MEEGGGEAGRNEEELIHKGRRAFISWKGVILKQKGEEWNAKVGEQ